MGEIIREKGYSTEIGSIVRLNATLKDISNDGVCASACTMAFAGGRNRVLGEGQSLGLHQISVSQDAEAAGILAERPEVALSVGQVLSALVINHLTTMGIDARIFNIMARTDASEIYWISRDEAENFDFITKFGYGEWLLKAHDVGVYTVSKRLDPTHPYSLVYESTIFCEESTGHAFVLLKAENIAGDPKEFTNLEAIFNFYINGGRESYTMDFSEIFTKQREGFQEIYVRLSEEIQRALRDADQFDVQLNVPRAMGGYFIDHKLSRQDQRSIRAAMNYCI